MKKRAPLVTFEGVEGVGKSTQLQAIAAHYQNQGLRVLLTREPGGTEFGNRIRDLLLRSSETKLDPNCELFLIHAARAQHISEILDKGLETHDLVLCDRFVDSSLAYQGGGRGMDSDWILNINKRICGKVWPTLTVLLDMDPSKSVPRALMRMKQKGGLAEDRFEKENQEFHRRVREAYLTLAKKDPGRFHVVDAGSSIKEVTKTILERVDSLLKKK